MGWTTGSLEARWHRTRFREGAPETICGHRPGGRLLHAELPEVDGREICPACTAGAVRFADGEAVCTRGLARAVSISEPEPRWPPVDPDEAGRARRRLLSALGGRLPAPGRRSRAGARHQRAAPRALRSA